MSDASVRRQYREDSETAARVRAVVAEAAALIETLYTDPAVIHLTAESEWDTDTLGDTVNTLNDLAEHFGGIQYEADRAARSFGLIDPNTAALVAANMD